MDTIEKIEKDFNKADSDYCLSERNREVLQIRILIQIAYELRVLAQKGAG